MEVAKGVNAVKQRREGRSAVAIPPTDPEEAARACLFSVLDRFNTEDPFWGSFIPEFDATRLGEGRFSLVIRGRGARMEVQGVMLVDAGNAAAIRPSIVVGGIVEGGQPGTRRWHPVTCDVGENGRFVTSNFRKAIEAAVDDVARSRRGRHIGRP